MFCAVPLQDAAQSAGLVPRVGQFNVFVAKLDAQVLFSAGQPLHVQAKRLKGGLGGLAFIFFLLPKLSASLLFRGQQLFKLGHPFCSNAVEATDDSFASLSSRSSVHARQCDATKFFRAKSPHAVIRSLELKPLKYSSSWGIVKLDPASSRNLRSCPPLISPKKRICFPPISFVSAGI
jgi:hypothetical protein